MTESYWRQLTSTTCSGEQILTSDGVMDGEQWLQHFVQGICERGGRAIIRTAGAGHAVFVQIGPGDLRESKDFGNRKLSAAEVAVTAEMNDEALHKQSPESSLAAPRASK